MFLRISFLRMAVLMQISLALGVVAVSTAVAQDSSDPTPADDAIFDVAPLRDGNRFVLGGAIVDENDELDQLHFEAQIAGDVPIWGQSKVQSLADGTDPSLDDGRRHWVGQAYATALFRLRTLAKPSAPVAPPSFMPKFTYQRLGLKMHSSSRASMTIIDLVPFGHHSNGQYGCPLTEQILPDGRCLPFSSLDQRNSRPLINVETGNFSTHYVRAGLYHRIINGGYNGGGLRDGGGLLVTTLGGAIEHHLDYPLIGGDLSKELRSRYGPTRLQFTIGLSWDDGLIREFVRFDQRLSIQRIFGVTEDPTVVVFEQFMYFNRRPDLGMYLRVYHGRDYYNINFEKRLQRLEFGLTFNWQTILRAAF